MKKDSILIVDDEYLNQYILQEILNEYSLLFAENSKKMEKILAQHIPDLILLDIMLPEKDGITIAKELQKNAKFSSIPIIFLSARIDSQDIKNGFESGAYDYITKPFDETVLKTRIKAALAKKSHENEYVQRYLVSNERYKNLFEQSNDAIFIHTYKGDILEVNERASQLLIMEREELLQKNMCQLFDNSENDCSSQFYETTVRNDSLHFQSRFRRSDNQVIDIDSSARIVDQDNKIIQSVIRDITQQKTYEQKLKNAKRAAEQANRTKDVFVANISHELRTPLNGILGFAELLHKRLDKLSKEEVKEYVYIISDSGRHLLDIVNDLLDLTLIEADQINLVKKEFNLTDMIHAAVQVVKEAGRGKNIKVVEQYAATNGLLNGDERRLKQVFFNLLSNAVKYTDSNREIGILVEDADYGWVRVTVWDQGKGIPEDKLQDIFLPFEQLKKNYTDISGGIGIGLTLVKRIITLHGGKISVTSKENEGTRFVIYLNNYVRPVESEPNQSTHNSGEERILVVDDDKAAIILISKVLSMNSINFDCCGSGEEALYRISEQDYSLIIMDIQLPGLDGVLTMKAIKEQYELPILAQTAYAMKGDRESLLAEGFDDYIAKPVTEKTLLDKLKKYIKSLT